MSDLHYVPNLVLSLIASKAVTMAAELMSTKLNPENHLILEQPLLKVPYELSRKNFKTAQRHVERERDQLLSSLKQTTALSRTTTTPPAQNGTSSATSESNPTLQNLDNMIHRLETLKRKLSSLHAAENTAHRATKARLTHLSALHSIHSVSDVAFDTWSSTRLNRLLVDYLLRQGYNDSARSFAAATDIQDLVDVDAFTACSAIERSLRDGHNTNEALGWCSENKQSLKKMGSNLEFDLRLQQYVELVRTREPAKLAEAWAFARKHLAPAAAASTSGDGKGDGGTDAKGGGSTTITSGSGQAATMDEGLAGGQTLAERAVQAAALLAYGPDTPFEPYASLYSSTRWTYLADLFISTHHSLLSLPPLPSLHIALGAGLSALKTPSCHSAHAASSGNAQTSTGAGGTGVCPICSTELNELAREVPYANRTKSCVEEEPVVLPNGRVFGRERLTVLNEKMVGLGGAGVGAGRTGVADVDMSGDSDAAVRDPMDPGQIFRWGDVRKVYIS